MERAASLSGAFVWAFAVGAVVLGAVSGVVTADMGATVSSSVYFVIFLICGFMAAFLTRAGKLASVGAFLLAAVLAAGGYYLLTTAMVSEAADAAGASNVGSGLGAVLGIFVAVVTFLVSSIAGLGGVLAGHRARTKATA